jgi:aspartate carbamoyltransferase catalytic subunit
LYALSNYNVNVKLISPPSLKVRSDSTYEIRKKLQYTETSDLEDNLEDLDVIYVTRIQRERFADIEEYVKVRGSYKIGPETIKKIKDDAIIMHPLPRLDEISPEIDSTKHAKYFKQAQYGKDTRAALLALILNENGI